MHYVLSVSLFVNIQAQQKGKRHSEQIDIFDYSLPSRPNVYRPFSYTAELNYGRSYSARFLLPPLKSTLPCKYYDGYLFEL